MSFRKNYRRAENIGVSQIFCDENSCLPSTYTVRAHWAIPQQLKADDLIKLASKMLKSTAWTWLWAEMVRFLLGSQTTMSASEPTATTPFRGYKLKILAAFVLVTATNRVGSIMPACTPFSQSTAILSSTPFTPLGIFEKSSLPAAFCSALNVQLSLPITWRLSLKDCRISAKTELPEGKPNQLSGYLDIE